jgi:hypothetical protein
MRAIAEISTIPSSMNLTRRAALGGLAVFAAPASAAAVCLAPPEPDAELVEIGRRLVHLDKEATEAWAAWNVAEKPLRNAMIEYERTLHHLTHEARCDALDKFLAVQTRQHPEVERLYAIADAISDRRQAAIEEAQAHTPTTAAGFAVYAWIVKFWNPRPWRTQPEDRDLDQEALVRLVAAINDAAVRS